jgi:dTDP-4-dehydrorhamnose 3,5-epimerase
MKAHPAGLPDVLMIESPVFRDDRGFFIEVHHARKFADMGLSVEFTQDNHSRSVRNTLRGMHYQVQEPQGKLVRPVTGTIFDVAVDLRRSSPTFGRWTGFTLVAGDGRQLWIPPGFAHGFLVLSDEADVSYKCTTVYRAEFDRSLAWNDPQVGIVWPLPTGTHPLVSEKDLRAPSLAACETYP